MQVQRARASLVARACGEARVHGAATHACSVRSLVAHACGDACVRSHARAASWSHACMRGSHACAATHARVRARGVRDAQRARVQGGSVGAQARQRRGRSRLCARAHILRSRGAQKFVHWRCTKICAPEKNPFLVKTPVRLLGLRARRCAGAAKRSLRASTTGRRGQLPRVLVLL